MKHRLNSGKPATDNAVGNPERSLAANCKERAETKRRPQAGSKQAAPRPGEEIVRSAPKGAAVRRCKKCGETKPISEFYAGNHTCKDCYKLRVSNYQKSEQGRTAHNAANARYRSNHRNFDREVKKAYKKTEAGKASERRYRHGVMERNPEKLRARGLVNTHISRGKLTRPDSCSRCGAIGEVQAHHPDHNKPLEVEWLCRDCHRLADME